MVKVPICRAAISIHAPRTGSDEHDLSVPCLRRQFQSTLPARGATASCPSHPAPPAHFNPRSPHGERRGISYPSFYRKLFQSTLPARGATARRWTACGLYGISIHAPRTGSDLCAVDQPHAGDGISIHAPRTGSDVRRRPAPCRRWNFNPRSPHGERLDKTAVAV